MKDAIVLHSVEEVLEEVSKYPADDVYCIGGDSIYRQFLPYCDTAQVTKIDFEYQADSYFPNLDELADWICEDQGEWQDEDGLRYCFCTYRKQRS